MAEASEYSVYLLECADGSYYTGIAVDVQRRLAEHRSGPRGAKYVKGRLPVDLVYQCRVGSRSRALRCEYAIRKLTRRQKIELVAGQLVLDEVISIPESSEGCA